VAKGVFLHREDSVYRDLPAEQYQFPQMYLDRARAVIGDWIIYNEPSKFGSRGYFAVAQVRDVVPDPGSPGMYLALIEPGTYLDFERLVPFRDEEGRLEREVPNAQWAVRPISDADFNRIVTRGFPGEEPLLPRIGTAISTPLVPAFADSQAPFILDIERERMSYYTSRPIRDRVFRRRVLDAYDSRCAITGLKFINGLGRAEVEAAHIKPVEANGPDSITNGLALSGTVHWMFDRGLISLSDDLEVLVSRQVNDSESVWNLVNRNRQASAPANPAYRPHPSYLAWHREHCFKH
jgi:putative restriction endonuclease